MVFIVVMVMVQFVFAAIVVGAECDKATYITVEKCNKNCDWCLDKEQCGGKL